MTLNIEITRIEPTKVAALEHRGPPELLNDSINKFIEWRKATGLSPIASSKTFGIAYDDPATTDPAKFRFDICGEVQAIIAENDQGIINKIIPGGRCAKLRHIGPHRELDDKIRYLYSTWLPESGELPRDFPAFFQYVSLSSEAPEQDQITDVYLLLE